jgi:hypothetical protein
MEDSRMVDLATLGPAHVDDVCELVISADLPGVDENDVEVTLSGDTLTIRGEKKVEHEEVTDEGRYRERRVQVLSRSIRLPFEVKDEDMMLISTTACSPSACTSRRRPCPYRRRRRCRRPCAGLRSRELRSRELAKVRSRAAEEVKTPPHYDRHRR